MILKLFAFPDETLNSRSIPAREREVQAYYIEHANAASRVTALKWLIAALLVFVGFAAWAEGDVEFNDHAKPAVAASRDDGAARNAVPKPRRFAGYGVYRWPDGVCLCLHGGRLEVCARYEPRKVVLAMSKRDRP